MSYDEFDAMEEAAHAAMFEGFIEDPSARDHFYEELYDEIVVDFSEARLRSLFEKEPEVAKPAYDALAHAKNFPNNTHDTAAIRVRSNCGRGWLKSPYFSNPWFMGLYMLKVLPV